MAVRIGIIAGGGALPHQLSEACRRDGKDCFVLGLQGHAEKADRFVRLGATQETIDILKSENVTDIVMVGAVRRPSLIEMRPDWRTIQVFTRLGLAAFGDDTLLRAVAEEFEKEGFKILGAHEIEPALLTPAGILTKTKPENEADIKRGIQVVKTLGALDVGQAAVVQQGIVLGVEGVEGTDALLKRCKTLRRKGAGGVLVKGCKPQQDKRLDLPTIGRRTVRAAYAAGLAGIAVEAGASILLDREAVVEAADKLGMFIVGYHE